MQVSEQTKLILAGLGGRENISDVDNCITRLRVTVKDSSLVNEEILKSTGAKGVFQKGVGVQIVYGFEAVNIKNNLEEALK